jgi:microcystin-dependent protein
MAIQTGDAIRADDFRGMIFPYAGATAPTGFLLCDGAAVSRTTYADLFALIGTTYGAGDGSTTFNVPDLRGRFAIGAGTGQKVATFVSRSGNVITVSGITNAGNNEFQTGQAVVYSASSGAITGLTDGATYYLIRISNTTFSLAASLADAQNGIAIPLSSNGTGAQTFTLTLSARTRGDTGGEENHAQSATELLAHVHKQINSTGSGTNAIGTQGSGAINGHDTGSTGGNAAMNVMSPFAVVNYIIKT